MRGISGKFTLLALLALTAQGATLAAQDAPGVLEGRLSDPDGRRVERLEADIVLTGPQGRAVGRARADGSYRIEPIVPGTYTLALELPTRIFERYERAGVVVRPGRNEALDLTLTWGMNLGTVGDDPLMQGVDLRAKTRNVDGPVPRTADGRPDLSGVWVNFGDSYAGAIPMQPWAQQMHDEWRKIRQDNPGAYCLPQSGLMTMTNYPYKFVQTPGLIVQLIEDMVISHRQIHLDGRGHPDPDQWNPSWYGHSIGRWEGDTLVVETVGFNESTPGFGIHSESLKVTDRFTRTSRGRLRITVTAEDPEAWTAPWVREREAGLAEGTEIVEFVCAEGAPAQSAKRAPWRARP
ncbi:MAG: carboxypeptidase regulatory-like domain-containing protein [Proteobacteria bacterium]|nr:carboxypeptidase regulatory-like domain-containing protein [Pseudomonadota bacterium]